MQQQLMRIGILTLSVMTLMLAMNCSSDRDAAQGQDGGAEDDESGQNLDGSNSNDDGADDASVGQPDVDQLTTCDPQPERAGATTVAECVGTVPTGYPQTGFGYEVGQILAPYSFTDYRGEAISVADYYTPEQSGLLVLSVAFMWCPHCRSYQPTLNRWYQQYRSTGVEVVVDVLQDYDRGEVDATDAETYRTDLGLDYTTAFSDPSGCFVGDFFGRVSAPQTVIVDRSSMKILLIENSAGNDASDERVELVLGACRGQNG